MHLLICLASILIATMGAPTDKLSDRDRRILVLFRGRHDLDYANLTSAKIRLEESVDEFGMTSDELLYSCTVDPNRFVLTRHEINDIRKERAFFNGRFNSTNEVLQELKCHFPKTYAVLKKRMDIFNKNVATIGKNAQDHLRKIGEIIINIFVTRSSPVVVGYYDILTPYFQLPFSTRIVLDRTFCCGKAILNGVAGLHAVMTSDRDIPLISKILY